MMTAGAVQYRIYSARQKNPPWGFLTFFTKRLGIFRPNFTHLLSVPIYARLQFFLFNHLQFWRSYAILSTTTQFTPHFKMSTISRNVRWHFLTFFPNSWEFLVKILRTYFKFLSTPDYKLLSNYPQLWRSYAILSATTQRAFQLSSFNRWRTFWA